MTEADPLEEATIRGELKLLNMDLQCMDTPRDKEFLESLSKNQKFIHG